MTSLETLAPTFAAYEVEAPKDEVDFHRVIPALTFVSLQSIELSLSQTPSKPASFNECWPCKTPVRCTDAKQCLGNT